MSRIRYLPVATFATLMGGAGLTLAWEKGAQVYGLPLLISQVLLALTLGLMLLLAASYAIKAVRFREEVCQEFQHPIKISFFPAFSIGLMLLATALHPYVPRLSLALWGVGAVLQLVLTLFLMNRWIDHS